MTEEVELNIDTLVKKTEYHALKITFKYLAGVQRSEINEKEKKATLVLDDTITNSRKLLKVVRALGYDNVYISSRSICS